MTSSDRDITPLVRSWLRGGENPSAGPVVADVLSLLDSNTQRAPRRTLPRLADVRRLAWVATLAAGAIVVVVAGAGLLRPPAGVGGSPSPIASSPAPVTDPPPSLASVGPVPSYPPGMSEMRMVVVEGIPLTYFVPTRLAQMSAWEPYGDLLISKSDHGPQGAEAILFWAGFPDGADADSCINGPTPGTADKAAAVIASAAGTRLVTGPTDVTVGGLPAVYVEVVVTEKAGCDPGFFYNWKAQTGGALWVTSDVGDTIRVWFVTVDGKLLFIGGETHVDAGARVQEEIRQIVASMRFG